MLFAKTVPMTPVSSINLSDAPTSQFSSDINETHYSPTINQELNDMLSPSPAKLQSTITMDDNDQLDVSSITSISYIDNNGNPNKRSIEELMRLVKLDGFDPNQLSNEEIIDLMISRQVSVYRLESILGKRNAKRCVEIRRQYYIRELELLDKLDQQQHTNQDLLTNNHSVNKRSCESEELNHLDTSIKSRSEILKTPQSTEFDYSPVVGACCENVVGCVRLPVGLVGPLILDNETIYVPLATTEGCLVASTSRGLSALAKSGGIVSRVRRDCMTRAPIVRFVDSDLKDALRNRDRAIMWLEDEINKEKIKSFFRSTSKHTNLIDYTTHSMGRELHIRFSAQTGDAMGMNMCSKGAEMALKEMQRVFPTMDILALSGNMCTDKKPSAINWVCGRGKSVECNASLSADVVEKVFKVSVDSLYQVWKKKVSIGSALAGSIGGFNCHAANIVAAIFIATGQDAAQVVSSSNCIIELEKDSRGSLEVHCYMPSIECGTVGGGTVLSDQSSYLQLMGIRGSSAVAHQNQSACENSNYLNEDSNACKLARIICATVMGAELSLLASLTEGTLVKSHMTHNRSSQSCKVV